MARSKGWVLPVPEPRRPWVGRATTAPAGKTRPRTIRAAVVGVVVTITTKVIVGRGRRSMPVLKLNQTKTNQISERR